MAMLKNLIIGITCIAIGGCTTTVYENAPLQNPHEKEAQQDLKKLQDFSHEDKSKEKAVNGRIEMLTAFAERLGYQQGFNSQMEIEQAKVLKNEKYWDQLLDYKRVARSGRYRNEVAMYVIGGILDKIDSSSETVHDKLVISKGDSFFLRQQPTLSQTVPYWFDKLFFDLVKEVKLPPDAYRYENDAERVAWESALKDGFEVGRKQAIDEMSYRWNALLRELIGMTRYWRFVELNKIKDIKVTTRKKGLNRSLTEDGKIQLDINTQFVTIDKDADFNLNTNEWDIAIISPEEDGNQIQNAQDGVITGDLRIEDLTNQIKVISTHQFESENEFLNGN
ncbi:type IV secretory system conjugative DNA transfer family protein [Photobacterium leiognathi]|uniref:type IV secretory system conjugative DNA transfer family protein n=1 Tax=Photobacterium leiognathi TaxID=553611 RepID=UPI002982641D|nr:type IV secretory system conjugative DNA transfer family protein [Photobacterium leiognathi]